MRTTLLILFLVGINISAISQKCINKPISPKEVQTNKNFFSGYMNVNGLRMYYQIKGKGPALLLIHGGTVCTDAYKPEISAFSKRFKVIAADNQGHGRTNDIDRDISYKNMALDQLALLDKLNIDSVIVFGHSDGAIVALNMVLYGGTNKIKKLILVGANYQPNGLADDIVDAIRNLRAEDLQSDCYIKYSPDGVEHWPVVFQKLQPMWLNEPNISEEELNTINIPTLIIVGDHDMVKTNHTIKMFENINNSQLLIFPNATHNVVSEKIDLIFPIIFDFIEKKESIQQTVPDGVIISQAFCPQK